MNWWVVPLQVFRKMEEFDLSTLWHSVSPLCHRFVNDVLWRKYVLRSFDYVICTYGCQTMYHGAKFSTGVYRWGWNYTRRSSFPCISCLLATWSTKQCSSWNVQAQILVWKYVVQIWSWSYSSENSGFWKSFFSELLISVILIFLKVLYCLKLLSSLCIVEKGTQVMEVRYRWQKFLDDFSLSVGIYLNFNVTLTKCASAGHGWFQTESWTSELIAWLLQTWLTAVGFVW